MDQYRTSVAGMGEAPCATPGSGASAVAGPRAAFTLLELMVVIALMVVVMGLAVGTFGTFQRDNRLQTAERLFTDLVRQARNTARTSSLPVILRITPTSDADGRITGGTISGITQTPLVSESFEDDLKWQNPRNVLAGTAGTAGAVQKCAIGRTGHGLRIETQLDPPTDLRWPSVNELRYAFSTDNPGRRLTDVRLRNQGFYLGIAIHMPNILATGIHHRPLVLVGTADEPAIDSAVAGLILRTQWRPMQHALPADPVQPAKDVLVNTYEVLGWVGDGHGQRSTISSVDDTIQQGPELHATASYTDFMANAGLNRYQLRAVDPFASVNTTLGPRAREPRFILRTNRWVDLGLLFDGRYLTLFIDHVAVNRREATVALPEEAGFNNIWYGAMRLPANLDKTYSHEAGPPYYLQDGILDDVRLLRLGSGQQAALPRGVRPWFAAADQHYELLFHPDGRCQQTLVSGNGASFAPVGSLILADVDDPNFLTNPHAAPGRQLTVSVDVTGRVTAQQPERPVYQAPAGVDP